MNRALLISKQDATHVDAYLQSQEGIEFHANVSLEALKTLLGDGAAILLCQTEWVSFIEVELPVVKPALLRVVVPNLVEEQLAEPIEQVHCAMPLVRESAQIVVAVVQRSHMENMINTYRAAGIYLEAIYPDIYLLPIVEDGWSCWKNDDRLCVRQDKYRGFALRESESESWLREMHQPEHMVYQHTDAIDGWVEALFDTPPPINLLQGDFSPAAPKTNSSLLKKSIYALGASFAIYFMYLILTGAILSHRLQGLQSETLSLYQQVFPGATQATSPRVVLSRELQKNGKSQQRFFLLLSTLNQGLSSAKDVQLTHLQFTGDRLTASITAKDFASLEALSSLFSQSNVSFKQESAEREDDHVVARIQLEVKS